jgi:gamma-glutamyltranspeptidase/glutathione hydrolase
MVRFSTSTSIRDASGRSHVALLTEQDFQDFTPRFEEPSSASYRGIMVHKCGPWSQGPVLLQALKLLERANLRALGRGSAAYVHVVTECMKLAFADRELSYGDPLFSKVPMDTLLSDEYAAERFRLVDPRRASLELRPGQAGDAGAVPAFTARSIRDVEGAVRAAGSGDTTKLEVIDAAGTMVSATTSGGWLQSSPVIPGLGFCLGTRGQMFSLEPRHPNRLEPGKRPRTTLTPTLATRDGLPYLSFGSPGGDQQDQWALQFFLNVVEFGMSLQEAVEAPTFWTNHFPSSFYPRKAEPGSLTMEARCPPALRQELAALGHLVSVATAWAGGNTLAASVEPASGVLCAAASPRLDPAYAAAF